MSQASDIQRTVDKLQHELFFRRSFERVLRENPEGYQQLLKLVQQAEDRRHKVITSTIKRGHNGKT